MSRVNRTLITAGAILFWLGVTALVASAGIHYFGPSTVPPAAAPTSATRNTAAAPAVVEQQSEVRLTSQPAPGGVVGAGETATPLVTSTPQSAFEGSLDFSPQARSVEPMVLSGAQIYGLSLYVSDSFDWAEQAVPVATCESTNGARRVKVEANGTVSRGLWMVNSVWAYRFDVERAEHDDVYAAQITYELWQDTGDWGPWEACRP